MGNGVTHLVILPRVIVCVFGVQNRRGSRLSLNCPGVGLGRGGRNTEYGVRHTVLREIWMQGVGRGLKADAHVLVHHSCTRITCTAPSRGLRWRWRVESLELNMIALPRNSRLAMCDDFIHSRWATIGIRIASLWVWWWVQHVIVADSRVQTRRVLSPVAQLAAHWPTTVFAASRGVIGVVTIVDSHQP